MSLILIDRQLCRRVGLDTLLVGILDRRRCRMRQRGRKISRKGSSVLGRNMRSRITSTVNREW
ncbi:hypothetical protein DOTSEDRAFT_47985 [Dothistroma septosporum NZE10]|uniref:Uncharacterized protein n=1 Tax=Dothistroma septosporum (strain NZE10 / CBS 128990) TaxID=675120 RepID=M2YKV3_DOTSN|nr:hypothetical protein DOTSEDRAFT_47985 [Dothistroma septosporum NZE10]